MTQEKELFLALDSLLAQVGSRRFPEVSTYPSQAYEEAYGLHGISTEYTLPDGLTEPKINQFINLSYHKANLAQSANTLWQELEGKPQNIDVRGKELAERQERHLMECARPHDQMSEEEKDRLRVQEKTLAAEMDAFNIVHSMYPQLGVKTGEALDFYQQASGPVEQERMSALYDALVAANPELKAIEIDAASDGRKTHVVWGVASRFNVSDMKSYIQDGMNGKECLGNASWLEKARDVCARGGYAPEYAAAMNTGQTIKFDGGDGIKMDQGPIPILGWFPSQTTLEYMQRQLDKREVKDQTKGR